MVIVERYGSWFQYAWVPCEKGKFENMYTHTDMHIDCHKCYKSMKCFEYFSINWVVLKIPNWLLCTRRLKWNKVSVRALRSNQSCHHLELKCLRWWIYILKFVILLWQLLQIIMIPLFHCFHFYSVLFSLDLSVPLYAQLCVSIKTCPSLHFFPDS